MFANNQMQRSSSTSSSKDLISEKSLSYSLENHMKPNCDNEQQCKIKNSNSFRLKNRKQFEKQFDKQQLLKNQQQQKQQLEQDLLTLKSTLIESKKKLTKKLNIKFRQQTTPNEKIKRRVYEQFECAVILNDCSKMATLFKENPKLDLSYDLRPDGNTLLHTAIRHQCKDALSWLASLYSRAQLNQQNSIGESPLHLAVREQSPILVNILLNHKACNHVQNLNKETPLHLALNLYIKYRNLKDYDCVLDRNLEQFNSAQIKNSCGSKLQHHHHQNNSLTRINERNASSMKINSCFCQKREKSFDLHQLETNNIDTTAAKFNLQPNKQHEKENDSNDLNRLTSQSNVLNYNNPNRNHLSKLDDLTAVLLNKQNRNCCCALNSNNESSQRQRSHSSRFELETINNCRLMRKIVMAILHDSDPNSWQMRNSKGQTVVCIAKEHQVDFVYDFICNYQKLTVIIKPEQVYQLDRIDQNGNYLSTAASETTFRETSGLEGDQYSIGKQLQTEEQVGEQVERENSLDFETKNELTSNSANTSLERASSRDQTPSNTNANLIASALIKTEKANARRRNETSFFSSFSSSSFYAANHYKRKTDDEQQQQQQQYCLKEQRSIIKQDNFNKLSTMRNTAPTNSISRFYFRKSNRSHSITLGNIKLERDHNLFTSSCSLNRLSELENRKYFDHFQQFNNLDVHLEKVGNLLEEQQQQQKCNHIDRPAPDRFPLEERSENVEIQNRTEFEFPVTYTNIPNEFAEQHHQRSIHCSKGDQIAKQQKQTLMNQTNVKTALAVYQ